MLCRLPPSIRFLALASALTLAGALWTGQVEAQAGDPGATEDVAAGSKTVRGHYNAGGIQADWEAAVREGKIERIVEWRDYGDYGNANVVFDYFNGQLMHYGERSQRRGGQAGAADSFRRVALNLNFSNGRFTTGSKTIDGIDTELDEPDISGAQAQSRFALERVMALRSAWQNSGHSTSFSLQSVPVPDMLPSEAARQLAGGGGLVDYRCDGGLHVLLGAAEDRMVVDRAGQPPLVLDRQPPGARYDFMGGGWGAERRGDTVRLDQAGGPSLYCGVVAASAPPSAVPAPSEVMPGLPKPPAPPLPAMPPVQR